jgi:hypothetical protein
MYNAIVASRLSALLQQATRESRLEGLSRESGDLTYMAADGATGGVGVVAKSKDNKIRFLVRKQ